MINYIYKRYFIELENVWMKIDYSILKIIISRLHQLKVNNNTFFLCGNGGSACNASHAAVDFLKLSGIRSISLSDNAGILTAYGNDISFKEIFAGQIKKLASKNDVLFILSVSGCSENVVRAAKVFKEMGGFVVSFIGKFSEKNTELRILSNESIEVYSDDYGIVESVHQMLMHIIASELRKEEDVN